VFFWEPMLSTERIFAIIAFERHVGHISTIGTLLL